MWVFCSVAFRDKPNELRGGADPERYSVRKRGWDRPVDRVKARQGRTGTRFGRGQRGLGRVARNCGLYAKWHDFIVNYKICNGLRVDLLEFPDFA